MKSPANKTVPFSTTAPPLGAATSRAGQRAMGALLGLAVFAVAPSVAQAQLAPEAPMPALTSPYGRISQPLVNSLYGGTISAKAKAGLYARAPQKAGTPLADQRAEPLTEANPPPAVSTLADDSPKTREPLPRAGEVVLQEPPLDAPGPEAADSRTLTALPHSIDAAPELPPAHASTSEDTSDAERPARRLTLDHRGSLGVLVGLNGSFYTLEKAECLTCDVDELASGFGAALDLGVTLALGWEGSEFLARVRLNHLSEVKSEALFLGFRSYFGRDEWKTFADFELACFFRPILAGGGRAAFGVAWDFSPLFGLWAELGANVGLGRGRVFGAELGIGIQGRTYLFE